MDLCQKDNKTLVNPRSAIRKEAKVQAVKYARTVSRDWAVPRLWIMCLFLQSGTLPTWMTTAFTRHGTLGNLTFLM